MSATRRFALFLLLVLPPLWASDSSNQLAGHASPYLAMHGADPVHWQDWDTEILRRAQTENRLILISSGYFACHWCHVMQRESYQDPEVAELLNRHFIAVKLDRELHPALDAHLVDFVRRTRGQAGWPLNVFLSPKGYPLVGFTYAPKDKFVSVLQRLVRVWGREGDRLSEMARQASEQRETESIHASSEPFDPLALRQSLIETALAFGDDLQGGFGRQSRFPMAPQLLALLDILAAKDHPELRNLVRLTLDQMATQGLRDHISGGFFRYTVDPGWQVPHFEKMLYTQALLVRVYLRAAKLLSRPDYREVARETLEFVLRELAGGDGGYIASLSAVDSQGAEGGCYLWSDAELDVVLAPHELAVIRMRWGIRDRSPSGEGHLPVLAVSVSDIANHLGLKADEVEANLAQAGDKLLAARAQCLQPRDGKRLAGWNGLLLSALADAAEVWDDPSLQTAGDALAGFVRERFWDGTQLKRSVNGVGDASLEDYAYLASGVWDWGSVRRDDSLRALAKRLATLAWEQYFSAGGWREGEHLGLPGQLVQPALVDGALPSPSALLVSLSFELASVDEAPVDTEELLRAVRLVRGVVLNDPFENASSTVLLLAVDHQSQVR